MPIQGVIQPDIIPIDTSLRLRKYDGKCDFALAWYQDVDTVYLVDGKRKPYTMERLVEMYEYLNCHGELYFIEVNIGGSFMPVGDVTFSEDDIPIVIGDVAYRGHGIGGKVIQTLIRRGKTLGYSTLFVEEIYNYNEASKRCFMKAGFVPYEKTSTGNKYMLLLF